MNIQARNFEQRRNRSRRQQSLPRSTKLWLIGGTLLLAAMAFGIVNVRVALNEQISNVQRETQRVKSELYEIRQEIAALELQRETLSAWPNVKKHIIGYNLNLRAPAPSQIHRLSIIRRTDNAGRIIARRQTGTPDRTRRGQDANVAMR